MRTFEQAVSDWLDTVDVKGCNGMRLYRVWKELSPEEIITVVATNNERRLWEIPFIGLKSARAIITALRSHPFSG